MQQQEDGVYELSLPMSGDIPVPVADLDADMGRWVQSLFHMKSGVTLVGSTERLTWKEWLDLWARRNQVSARYRQADPSEYAARLEGISEAVAEEFKFIEKYGFTGGNKNAVYPDEVFIALQRCCKHSADSYGRSKADCCQTNRRPSRIRSRTATGPVYFEDIHYLRRCHVHSVLGKRSNSFIIVDRYLR